MMIGSRVALALLLALAGAAVACHAAPVTLYVATTGDDGAMCTQAAPCATPNRARDVIRSMRGSGGAWDPSLPGGLPAGGVVVSIASGDYHAANDTTSVLTLQAQDSGANASGIVYAGAVDGKSTRLLGGKVVPTSAFKPYSGNIMQADLSALGLTRFGKLRSGALGQCTNYKMNVYVNGRPMVLARYPNISPSGQWQWLNIANVSNSKASFQYSGTRPASWVAAPDAWLHGYWAFGWADNHVKVSSIDTATSTITVSSSTPPLYEFKPTARYYAENILAELDAPGEYYINASTGTLYLYPPTGLSNSQVVVSVLDTIVSLDGTSYVTLANLSTNFAQGAGVVATSVTNTHFTGLNMSMQGREGMTLIGSDSTVTRSTVLHVGCSGITTSGGDYTTLTPGNLVLHNNTIGNFALWKRTYNPAIAFNGVGNVYTNNNLFDSPHTGMLGSGNDHLFAFNNFTDMCYEVTDAGAWYSGRSWAHRGSKLIGNRFLRIRNTEKTFLGAPAVNAIYFDDQLSAHFTYNNVIIDSHQGILLGGGRRHQIHGNTFINVPTAVAFDDRGLTWQKQYCQVGGIFEKELEALHYQQPPYSTTYPQLPNIMNEHPCTPVYNNISSNTYCNGTFIDQTSATISGWLSTAYNNVATC